MKRPSPHGSTPDRPPLSTSPTPSSSDGSGGVKGGDGVRRVCPFHK